MKVFNIANGKKMVIDLDSIKLILRENDTCIRLYMLIRSKNIKVHFDSKEDADIFFNYARDTIEWELKTNKLLAYEGVIISVIGDEKYNTIRYITEDAETISELFPDEMTNDEFHEVYEEITNMIFK